jgi:tRNA-specific 2-thiouridylase
VIGRHKGLYGYTIGQRRGLGIAAPRPLYVIRLDLAQNRLVVGEKAALFRTQLTLSQLHWLYGPRPDTPLAVTTKIRYQHEGAKSWLSQNKQGQWQVQFEQPQLSITPGQAAVIYQGDVLLGGGWIE